MLLQVQHCLCNRGHVVNDFQNLKNCSLETVLLILEITSRSWLSNLKTHERYWHRQGKHLQLSIFQTAVWLFLYDLSLSHKSSLAAIRCLPGARLLAFLNVAQSPSRLQICDIGWVDFGNLVSRVWCFVKIIGYLIRFYKILYNSL